MTSAEIRELLREHETQRPDHLKCLHPQAPPHLRRMFTTWRDHKGWLEVQLTMALHEEENHWTDASGRVVSPTPWPAEPTAYVAEQRRKAEELREYRERKATRLVEADCRPRSENPSPKALKRREARARRRAQRNAGLVA